MDTLPASAGRKYETKSCKRSKMKKLQEKELHLPKIIIKKEDQAMDPDNGVTIKTLLTGLIPIMGRRTCTVDDFWTGDQTNSLTGTMEIDRIMGISMVKMELGEI